MFFINKIPEKVLLQNQPIINYIYDNFNNIQNNRMIKKIYNYYFHPSGVHYLVL